MSLVPVERGQRDAFADADLSKLRGRPLEVVKLRLEGFSPSQIAKTLGIAVKSVGVYTYFARRMLKMTVRRGRPLKTANVYKPDLPPSPPPPPANDVSAGDEPYDEEAPVPTLQKMREKGVATVSGRSLLSRAELRASALVVYPEDVERPRMREECANMPRPCPFVSCAHHLYLDVNRETGAMKLNFPHLEVWEMAETCSLDVADRGGITLDEVGQIMNLTRERIRQIEVRGAFRIREQNGEALGIER